jgi:hypothetical protein
VAITVVGTGAIASGVNSITPAFPAGLVINDVLIGLGETVGGVTFPTAASNGFVHVTGSPIAQSTNTSLHVIWRRWTTGVTAHAWGDSGDQNVGRYVALRGVKSTGNPWNATPVVATNATAVATATWSSVTTTVADCLVLLALSTGRDLATTANLGAVTNAALTSLTEQMDNWVADGGGGGIGLVTGFKTAAGAVGTSTATMGSTDTKSLMTLALEPEPAAVPTVVRRTLVRSQAVHRASRW